MRPVVQNSLCNACKVIGAGCQYNNAVRERRESEMVPKHVKYIAPSFIVVTSIFNGAVAADHPVIGAVYGGTFGLLAATGAYLVDRALLNTRDQRLFRYSAVCKSESKD